MNIIHLFNYFVNQVQFNERLNILNLNASLRSWLCPRSDEHVLAQCQLCFGS